MWLAHSANPQGERHPLVEHLIATATLARQFGGAFGAGDLAYWIGLWHDLGKFPPAFQEYLQLAEAHPEHRIRGPDHSAAGSVWAARQWDGAAFPIRGHHGGLPDKASLRQLLLDKQTDPAVQAALSIAREGLPGLTPERLLHQSLPAHLSTPTRLEFFLRFLFSALVDADFLDTERHFARDRATLRDGAGPSLAILWERLQADQARFSGRHRDPLNQARHEIYTACLVAADQSPGIFRLTVPTGGGKTRSSMAFGLRHALIHGLDRVIVAIPFTSIIEQTAAVYRGIFGEAAVLEHHSALPVPEGSETPDRLQVRARLASENWDARIIVTTTV